MSNWNQLRFHSTPNEIGDMLAGFAGALAFIWIVVTVLLQAAELREQRDQFEKMADAQEDQVKILVEQRKFYEREENSRREASARLQIDVLLQGISDLIDLEARSSSIISEDGWPQVFGDRGADTVDIHLFKNRNSVCSFFYQLDGEIVRLSRAIEPYLIIQRRLEEVAQLFEAFPDDQIARLRNMGLYDLQTGVNSFVEANIWEQIASDPANPNNFINGGIA